MYNSKVATATSAPRNDEHPSHIHALPPHDAAALSACAEFPTFSDAVAKVVHVVLPILEHEVWHTCVGGSPPPPRQTHPCHIRAPTPVGDEAASSANWACCADAVEVAVSLPTFAWDAVRRLPLPAGTRLSSGHYEAAPQPRRRKHKSEGVTAAVPCSPRLQAALDLLQRLAAVCADVCVAVWIVPPSRSHRGASCDSGPSGECVCIEGRWHGGQAVPTAGGGGARMGKAWPATADSPHAHLVTRCSVRGLFDNLPLRQSAFAYAEAGSRAAAWAAVSASAQRARRDAQTHLLTVLFHAALCTVLAPLYLARPFNEANHAAALTFTARLFTDGARRLQRGNTAVDVVLPLALTDAADTCDESALAGQPAHRGTLAGLVWDRYGLRRGCMRVTAAGVTAARGRCPPSLRAEVRLETRGEQTSRELCDVFGVIVAPPHLSHKQSGAQHDLPVFTEAVVLPGEFAVVFHMPPLDPSVSVPRAVLSPSLHRPAARGSAHFTFAAPGHQTSTSCVIVVARRGGPAASSPQSSLPSYSVLDPVHWAYDVVAAEARGGRRCGGTPAGPVPVFVFVDARHVPAHLRGSQPEDSQEGCTARRKESSAAFREMLKLAVTQLSSASQATTVAGGVEAKAHRADAPPQPSSPSPPVDTLSIPAVNVSAALRPSSESGNAVVGLRMHFVLRRVLEAAAATGTPSCLPVAPAPPAAGAGAAPLHRVRVTADALWQSATRGTAALAASFVAMPRRTPVSLHPKLSAVVKEERESEGRLMRVAARASEGMARMRHLLDTGRGSVLRQLPRACAPPQSWSPQAAAAAGGGAAVAGPPIGTSTAGMVAVVPWARKFILLADAASSGFSAGSPTRSSEESHALPSPHSRSHLCQRRWWLLDQHAVHERARLEFFLCFADTYVVHPELRSTPARCASVCAASPLCREAQQALRRRQQHTRLLSHLSHNSSGARHSSSGAELFTEASPTFPVVIPPEWRIRVGAVAAHLLLWGWRFAYGMVPSGTLLSLPTTVLAWPCVSVEGVVRCFTSLSVLTDTVEELEALGGAVVAPSPLHIVPAVVLHFLVSRSCRGAVMFGDAVTTAAARQLVAALGCVEQYYVCSHGRASFATLVPLTTQ